MFVPLCVCIDVHLNLAAIGFAEVDRNIRENGAWNSGAGDGCDSQRPFDSQLFHGSRPEELPLRPGFHSADVPESAPSLDVAFGN